MESCTMTSKLRRLFNGQSIAPLFVLLTASAAWAAPGVSIRFHGESTLHGFDGHAETADVHMEETPEGVGRIVATVSVPTMTTDHAARDRRMAAMFDAATFPILTGSATAADLVAATDGSTMPLDVVIAGHTNTLTATCRVIPGEAADGGASREWSFPVSLRAFGLKAPSVIGLIRVSDTVEVTARLNAEAWNMVNEGAR